MSQPKIANIEPYVRCLKPGSYYWCACGESERQPFCDGSHEGTDFVPLRFEVKTREQHLWLCGCKQSRNGHLCDGQHKRLAKKKGA